MTDRSLEPSAVLAEFPLLFHNESCTVWEGHLSFETDQFIIRIITPQYPSMEGASFECNPIIKVFLRTQVDSLKKCKTLLSFLYSINHILKSRLSVTKSSVELWSKSSLKQGHKILTELEKVIPQEDIVEISENFNDIKLKYKDHDGEYHFILFRVPPEYPKGNINILEVDLPSEVLESLSKINTIGDLYDSFIKCIDSLLPFWRMCKRLDEKAWVVDPQNPQKRDVHRRILLSEQLSVVLNFNPMDLSSYPDVQFLGSVKAVSEAKHTYMKNLGINGWREELDVAENIVLLFDITKLPLNMPSSTAKEDERDCFICFSNLNDNGEPSSRWCNNPNCASYYHHSCLVQWLQMVVSSTELSDHISGSCPYCGEKLWCQLKKEN